jgi:hypothetical protein
VIDRTRVLACGEFKLGLLPKTEMATNDSNYSNAILNAHATWNFGDRPEMGTKIQARMEHGSNTDQTIDSVLRHPCLICV